MGLKSIEVVTQCEVHGNNVGPIEIDGIRFCAKCVADVLLESGAIWVRMVTIENNETEAKNMVECEHCHSRRKDDKGACPTCGRMKTR